MVNEELPILQSPQTLDYLCLQNSHKPTAVRRSAQYTNMAYLMRRSTIAALLLAFGAGAQSCSHSLSPSYPAPVVAEGYAAQLIISGLTKPRSILFDTEGALLVVESGVGITHIALQDDGDTCIGSGNTTRLIDNKQVIYLSGKNRNMPQDFTLRELTSEHSLTMGSNSPRMARHSTRRPQQKYPAGHTTQSLSRLETVGP